MIETISGQIENMDTCYTLLEKYCTLKDKGGSRTEAETGLMDRLAEKKFGCQDEIPADYHLKIKLSFENYTASMLELWKAQIDLLTKGNYTEMVAQQKNTENAPAETCNYICGLEQAETVKSATGSVFDIGWELFKKFFY